MWISILINCKQILNTLSCIGIEYYLMKLEERSRWNLYTVCKTNEQSKNNEFRANYKGVKAFVEKSFVGALF